VTYFHWIPLAPMRLPRVQPDARELPDGRVVVTGGSSYAARTEGADEVWSPVAGDWGPSTLVIPRTRRRPALATRVRYRDRETTISDGRTTVTLRHGRDRPTLTPLDDHRVLVTGGFEQFTNFSWEDYDDSVESCELVDLARGTTEDAGTLGHHRHDHAAIVLGCGAVLVIGGRHDDRGPTAECELGLPDGFSAWDAFGPGLRDRLRAELDVRVRKAALARAEALRGARDLAAAVALGRDAAARWPDEPEVWAGLGRSLAASEAWGDAVAAYGRAVALRPDSAFDWGSLGACHVQAGERDQARAAFETVVELIGDGDVWTQSLARQAHDQLQFLALERGEIRSVATSSRRPSSSLQWNNQGVALLDSGRLAEALRCFAAAVKADRDNHFPWYNRSLALSRLGRPAEAKAAVVRAIALRERAGAEPARRSDAWVQHGIACYDLGDFAASVTSYDHALTAVETGLAHGNRGNSLFRLGRAEDALAAYERAIALGHNAWWGVACACCALDRLDEARAAEARAIELDPALAAPIGADPDLAALRPPARPPGSKRRPKRRPKPR